VAKAWGDEDARTIVQPAGPKPWEGKGMDNFLVVEARSGFSKDLHTQRPEALADC